MIAIQAPDKCNSLQVRAGDLSFASQPVFCALRNQPTFELRNGSKDMEHQLARGGGSIGRSSRLIIPSANFNWHSGAAECQISRPLHIRSAREWEWET